MEIRFNKTGAERKALVAAVSELTGTIAKYMGAPSFAFSVGGHVISKDGALDTGDVPDEDISSLVTALEKRGFIPSDAIEFTSADTDGAILPDIDGDTETSDTISIELPSVDFSDMTFDNLQKLIAGKAALIRRAIGDDLAEGAEPLPVVPDDDRIRFPWFRSGMGAEKTEAWLHFIGALCAAARKQKRVILKEKPLEEGASEKFAMRCFLLKIGFIGDEYKETRKIILSGLLGDGSHKMNKANGPCFE